MSTDSGETGHGHVDAQGEGLDTSTGSPNLHETIWGGGLADEVRKHIGTAPMDEAVLKELRMKDDALRLAHKAREILAFSKSDVTSVHSSGTAENRSRKLLNLAFITLTACGSGFPSSVDMNASMPSPVYATTTPPGPAPALSSPAVQHSTPTSAPKPAPAVETTGRGTQEQALNALASRIIKMVQDRESASAQHPARPTSEQPYIGPSFQAMRDAGLVGPPTSRTPGNSGNSGNPGGRGQGRSPQGAQETMPYIGPSYEAMRGAGLVGPALRQEQEMPQTRHLPTVGNPFSDENGPPPFYSLPATRNAVTAYEAGQARQRVIGNGENEIRGQAFPHR